MEREISLLDYGGRTDKNVDYRIKGNFSGINLNGFVLNYGKVNPGSGQLGIYEVTASNGKIYFVLIKDYRAMEGDWRIMLEMIKDIKG